MLLSAGTLAILILASLTYRCIDNYCSIENAKNMYKAGLQKVKSKDNPFYPEGQFAFYDSLDRIPFNSERQSNVIRLFKSSALMKMGREKEAIALLGPLSETMAPDPRDKLYGDVKKLLALTYLRLGERSNCIGQHSSGSCIFPLQGKGTYMDPGASLKAIEIFNQVMAGDPNDKESRWLLNVAYMTIGGYPSKVPQRWLIPGLDTDSSLIRVNAFKDISSDLNLNNFRSQAGGAVVEDFNNDGQLDVVVSSWDLDESMHYFKNNGDGTFADQSKSSGLSDIKGGLNLIQADYNNDGFTDILVLRGAWLGEFGKQPKTLLRNNGDGTFTDVTVESGILSFSPTQTGVWADFNNDGWLDLFIGNETTTLKNAHASELYINQKDGTFINVAEKAGCEKAFFMKGVTASDYNNDGWPDIFISGRDGIKMLLKNKGIKSEIPQFDDVTHEAGLDKEATFTFPTWFFDYNNDGWPDIFVCGYQFQGSLGVSAADEALHEPYPANTSMMYLYRNNRDGTFTNVAKEMGLDKPVFAMGANFGDIDNDGWLDMYLGTGNPDFTSLVPNRMFKNIGGQKFTDVTASARVGNLQKGHGVAFADIDNDGDQDIFAEIGGAYAGDGYYNSLYLNPGQGTNHWISIALEGTKSNRSAIGAHIVLNFTDDTLKRSVYMDINSGGSFGANPFRKEIGIGKAKVIDELIVKWPTSGLVQVFKHVEPGQFLTIKEGSDRIVKMNPKRLKFAAENRAMNMIDCAPMKP